MRGFVVFACVFALFAVSVSGAPAAIMIADGNSILGYDSCGNQTSVMDAGAFVSNLHVENDRLYYETAGGDLHTMGISSNTSSLWCTSCLPSGEWTISGSTIVGYGAEISTRAVNSSASTTMYTPAAGATIVSVAVADSFAYWIEETSTGSSIWAANFPSFSSPTTLEETTDKARAITVTNNVVVFSLGLKGRISAFEKITSLPSTVTVSSYGNAIGTDMGAIAYLAGGNAVVTVYSRGGTSGIGVSMTTFAGCVNVVKEPVPVGTTYIAGFGSLFSTCPGHRCFVPSTTTTASTSGSNALVPSWHGFVCIFAGVIISLLL